MKKKDKCLVVKRKDVNVRVDTSEEKVTPEMQKNVDDFIAYVKERTR